MKKVLVFIMLLMSCLVHAGDTLPVIDSVVIYPRIQKDIARFGDRLEVHGRYLKKLIAVSKNKDNPIVLYLDNYRLSTVRGQVVDDSIVYFTLDATLNAVEQDKGFWTSEYKASLKDSGRLNPVLKIGTMDGTIASYPYRNFYFRIYRHGMKVLIWWLFIVFCVLLGWASWKKDILRETCECNCTDKKTKGGKVKKKRKPFSLSRTQMAFWTVIVAFSFTYIYFITGEMPDVTQGTLILLGISSSTTLGGSLIDSNDVTSNSQNAPADRCCSQGFLKDILSDGGILGIHRLQNVLFTVILGIIYVTKALGNLEMTEFSTNLLLLMGISSGTYLGVKYFANQSLAQNTQTISLKTPATVPIALAKSASVDLEFVTTPLNSPLKFTCVGDDVSNITPKPNEPAKFNYKPSATALAKVTITASLVNNTAINTSFDINIS